MKTLKFFIILLFAAFVSCTKKTKDLGTRNDSVEKYLQLASIDTLPIEARRQYNAKAFSFIDLEKNDTTVRWYLSEISLNLYILIDSLNYHKVSNLHIKKANEAKDTLSLARFYRFRAAFHRNYTRKYDSSFFYFRKAEKMYMRTNDLNGLATVYLNQGKVQLACNDFLGSELSTTKAYKIFKDCKLYNKEIEINIQYANIYTSMAKYDLALKYHKKVYLAALKLNNRYSKYGDFLIGTSLNNIGNNFKEIKDYHRALFYFDKALSYKNELKKDILLKAFLLNNSGFCKLQLNKAEKSKVDFEKAAKIFDSLKIKDEESLSNMYLSNFYAKTKDTVKAIYHAEEAMELAKESKAAYYYLCTLANAGEVNKKKAPFYIKEYHRLSDSLLFEERKARNQFFKIQLETDEIAQEKEKAIKQKWVQTSIIATVLLIVILLFIIFKQRAQKKEFVLIQNQQKANEEIYQLMLNQQVKEEEAKQKEKKRIALELHDNVMNKLASTRFNLFALTQQQDDTTLQSATQSITKIKEVEDEIRNLTHVLAKETFARNDSFASLLDELIRQQNQLQATPFTLTIDPKINWDDIGSEVKMNYYRIIQEALHNTNKHAQANQGEINIQLEHNQLQLTLTDDGVGFDAKANPQGIGLQNMQQRMELIGGTLSISATPGKGTAINCSVLV